MSVFVSRALGAVALVALGACASPAPTPVASSTVPPGTPVVAATPAVPVVTVPPAAIATPPVAAAPVIPVVPVAPGAGTSAVPLAAANRLLTNDVRATLAGNTISGVDARGQPYVMFLSGDGQLRFRQGNAVDAGSWRVGPDGRFCSSLAQNRGLEDCYWLYRTGTAGQVRFDRLDGTPMGTFRVEQGNRIAL